MENKQAYQLNARPQLVPSILTLAMTLTSTFKVKYLICYILGKNGMIAMKWKINISIKHLASMMAIKADLGHDLEHSWVMSITSYMSEMGGLITMK